MKKYSFEVFIKDGIIEGVHEKAEKLTFSESRQIVSVLAEYHIRLVLRLMSLEKEQQVESSKKSE